MQFSRDELQLHEFAAAFYKIAPPKKVYNRVIKFPGSHGRRAAPSERPRFWEFHLLEQCIEQFNTAW